MLRVVREDGYTYYYRRVTSADGVRGLVCVSLSPEIAEWPDAERLVAEMLDEEVRKAQLTVVETRG